jgi:hypothetical protein
MEKNKKNEKNTSYIGAGVYVKYDGYGIELMTGSHDHPENVVYLEPDVYTRLLQFVESLKNKKD